MDYSDNSLLGAKAFMDNDVVTKPRLFKLDGQLCEVQLGSVDNKMDDIFEIDSLRVSPKIISENTPTRPPTQGTFYLDQRAVYSAGNVNETDPQQIRTSVPKTYAQLPNAPLPNA